MTVALNGLYEEDGYYARALEKAVLPSDRREKAAVVLEDVVDYFLKRSREAWAGDFTILVIPCIGPDWSLRPHGSRR